MKPIIAEQESDNSHSRRNFLRTIGVLSGSLILPTGASALVRSLENPVRIGLIADLHQDIMHDGETRLDVFVEEMAKTKPDAIIQLGDFAYPNEKNMSVIDKFNKANRNSLHVKGNHDTDNGHTNEQCLEVWGMSNRYYSQDIGGLRIIALDCNDVGSPTHKGGYPLYIGEEQFEWLEEQIEKFDGPVLLASHQPLAGPYSIDNAKEVQLLLSKYSDKVVISVNGHTHIDDLVRVGRVPYFHVNSASYQWVGGDFKHESYPKEIHDKYPWIGHTCPYKDSLFTTLTFDPESGTISVKGRKSEWLGSSPAELGAKFDEEARNGEEIVPFIRDWEIKK